MKTMIMNYMAQISSQNNLNNVLEKDIAQNLDHDHEQDHVHDQDLVNRHLIKVEEKVVEDGHGGHPHQTGATPCQAI